MPAAPISAVPVAAPVVTFCHNHFYVDSLKPLEEYKQLEAKLNEFAGAGTREGTTSGQGLCNDVEAGRAAWLALSEKLGNPSTGEVDPEKYKSFGQDLVEQLMVALGCRVTGSYEGPTTRTLMVTSQDPTGIRFICTAQKELSLEALAERSLEAEEVREKRRKMEEDPFQHFDVINLERYSMYHRGRQGCGALGFSVQRGGIDLIYERYKEGHPKLLLPDQPRMYGETKVLEVYAYYLGDNIMAGTVKNEADPGTVLRFVEAGSAPSLKESNALPGVAKIPAAFDGVSPGVYADHWVSNVYSRTGCMDTLEDTLNFITKADYNAGGITAGEASIESTVIGNTSNMTTNEGDVALKDQSQVFLPINNAMSEVGHVYGYLQELGQGIQHIAQRTGDLVSLIERANQYRKITGAGLIFNQIPRSYFGSLTTKHLVEDCELSKEDADKCIAALKKAEIVNDKDIVDLEVTAEKVRTTLPDDIPSSVVPIVLRARYNNLYRLLKDSISESTYLRLVKNNILVDVQGQDLLMQIFCAKILQREASHESCFLEFVQRICSEKIDPATGKPKPFKPGCGGFGIRNFLTLFLSIEVSKAYQARENALKEGDAHTAEFARKRVDIFTRQLDDANPIMTAISKAMTAEGIARDNGDAEAMEKAAQEKAKENENLKLLNARYKEIMKKCREEEELAAKAK